jgi:hypothetical protein
MVKTNVILCVFCHSEDKNLEVMSDIERHIVYVTCFHKQGESHRSCELEENNWEVDISLDPWSMLFD